MLEGKQSIEFAKYEETIEELKFFLLEKLGGLAINSAIFFGSSTIGEGYFREGISDIDVCAFSDRMNHDSYDAILDEIKKSLTRRTSDKSPILLRDHTADRIEFFMEFPDINIDMNIMPPGLPNIEKMSETASHDSLDLLFANFYQYGIPFIGETPLKDEINEKFLPFYDDDIRKRRLAVLTTRVQKNNERVLSDIERGCSVFDDVYRSRSYFLKWLFIFKKTYPISLTKHLDRQLEDLLGMNREEIDILQFGGNEGIIDLTKKYIGMTEWYIDQFNNERGGDGF